MKIGMIQASSQASKNGLIYSAVKDASKNGLIYSAVKDAARGYEIIDFGCFPDEKTKYSYIEISVIIGFLLNSGAVDFIVTGCSSGQGMMLACNSMPGVICGYAPTPMDAYLFAQINDGNAISLPLGEEYTYKGDENLIMTIIKLFSEPFAQGYPKKDAERKLNDTRLLKRIRHESQKSFIELADSLDKRLLEKALSKKDAIDYIITNGTNGLLIEYIKKHRSERE